jgi:hypothetical protein
MIIPNIVPLCPCILNVKEKVYITFDVWAFLCVVKCRIKQPGDYGKTLFDDVNTLKVSLSWLPSLYIAFIIFLLFIL